MTIYDELAELFWNRAYLIKKDGERIVPDAKDIEQMVDGAVRMIYTDEEGTSVAIGKMLIRKNHRGRYDIFLWMGEVE